MASKNDLSAFKEGAGSKGVLRTKPKRVGRPPVEEKRTFKVTLSFTEAEGALLQRKAGIVPLATMLKAELQSAGVLEEA